MAYNKKIKNLKGRSDDSYIVSHYIVPYSIVSNNRYKRIDELRLYDGKNIKATLNNRIDLNIDLSKTGATTYIVPASEENRIDLVALKAYGSSSLYWVICYANSIADPLDLPVGAHLIIPNLTGLRDFPNPLS